MTDFAPPVLETRGLRYAYSDGPEALRGVDLAIGEGERVALLGPNGAGKTTVMLLLAGLLEPSAGECRVGGVRVEVSTTRDIRRRLGLVFQDPDDQLFMTTVADDVAFGPKNYGVRGEALDARVDDALAQVGMQAVKHRAPHHLSMGERRRVALATVLAMDADILVLDEPSANLDPLARAEFADVLARLGRTVLMVTHDLPYAREVCDRALILDGGVIVADGPADAIISDAALLRAHRLAPSAVQV